MIYKLKLCSHGLCMVSIYLQGGLGNQLFQIFTAIAYAIEYKEKLTFPAHKADGELRPTYWDSLLKRLKGGIDPTIKDNGVKIFEETFHYTPLQFKKDAMLVGYFQSYKYFDKQYDAIFKKLNFKMEQEIVRQQYLTLVDTISLHFRIGDYTTQQLHHNILSDAYYISAISEIIKQTGRKNWNIIYFCESKDNVPVTHRIRKIKKQFPDLTIYKADDDMLDWEQLLLMSCSNHNIIANSAFSWWAARINSSPDKVVCYPKQWFGPVNNCNNTQDLCPPSWTSI